MLAEAILRKDGAGRFNAFSAGSRPKGVVNPLALSTLAALDPAALIARLREIGRREGATRRAHEA